jgi:hypothetical protein
MKAIFETYEEAAAKVAEIDLEMSFPDPVSGTQTWAVPEKVEVDGVEKWEVILPEIEVGEYQVDIQETQDDSRIIIE